MHLKRVTGMFFLVDISFWNSKIIKKLFNHHGFSKVSACIHAEHKNRPG